MTDGTERYSSTTPDCAARSGTPCVLGHMQKELEHYWGTATKWNGSKPSSTRKQTVGVGVGVKLVLSTTTTVFKQHHMQECCFLV
jgi:hypothetical protein